MVLGWASLAIEGFINQRLIRFSFGDLKLRKQCIQEKAWLPVGSIHWEVSQNPLGGYSSDRAGRFQSGTWGKLKVTSQK